MISEVLKLPLNLLYIPLRSSSVLIPISLRFGCTSDSFGFLPIPVISPWILIRIHFKIQISFRSQFPYIMFYLGYTSNHPGFSTSDSLQVHFKNHFLFYSTSNYFQIPFECPRNTLESDTKSLPLNPNLKL